MNVEANWARLNAGVREQAARHIGGNAVEQYGAELRDVLDAWGVSISDPDALYCVLVGQRVLLTAMVAGVDLGHVQRASLREAYAVYNGILGALAPALPEEARR